MYDRMYRLLPNVFLEYSLIYFVTPSYSVDIFYYSYGTRNGLHQGSQQRRAAKRRNVENKKRDVDK